MLISQTNTKPTPKPTPKHFIMASTDYTTNHAVLCDDEQIEQWRAEVNLLKPRKRKNWKGSLTDKWNVKSKVIYNTEKDKFYNWSLLLHCWAVVETYSASLDRGLMARLKATKVSEVEISPMMRVFLETVARAEKLLGMTLTAAQQSAIMAKVIEVWAEGTKTGKHVPVADRASSNKRRYAVPQY